MIKLGFRLGAVDLFRAGTGTSCPNKHKSPHMDGFAGHRSTNDALQHFTRPVTTHAATVSGRTSMAEQPGTATDSKESTPLPS